MINIKAGNQSIAVYGSIKELPIERYKLMQSYLLQSSGIGDSIAAIDERLSTLITLLENKRHDEATEETKNLRLSFFSTLTGLGFKTKAFACMIYSIDDQPVTDTTTEGLAAIVEILSTLTVDELNEHWENVKKKLIPNYTPISQDGLEMTSNTLKT